MAKIRRKEKAKLLEQIAKDLETATRQAHSAAGSALNDAKAGRMMIACRPCWRLSPGFMMPRNSS